MDVKSLYTTISNRDGLLALTHILNKRPVLQPPTYTLGRFAELVLTLNTFSFNRKYYSQTGEIDTGVDWESTMRACLRVTSRNKPLTSKQTNTRSVQTVYR